MHNLQHKHQNSRSVFYRRTKHGNYSAAHICRHVPESCTAQANYKETHCVALIWCLNNFWTVRTTWNIYGISY